MLPVLVAALALAFQPGLASGQAVKNPDTYVRVVFGDWDTLDYAWAYDTASFGVIFNIYEPLIFFDGTRIDRYVPMLATAVPSLQNKLLSPDGRVYRFPIRQGVKFHDGTPMTAEDVVYSLQRFLLIDRAAGPSSLLLEPILGITSTRDDKGALKITFAQLQRAIRAEGNTVVITLPEPYGPFLSIMAQWSYVVSKRWAIANGDWNGTAATMAKHNNPKKESTAFFEKANGTGPFKLERWDRAGRQMILVRNDNYWRTPARLRRVVIRQVEEPATRILMLKAGDADDDGGVTRRELPQYEGVPGIRIIDDLPTGTSTNPAVFFTFDIDCRGNPDCGSGRLDGAGIPPNFFSDVNVRRGFAYSLDYNTFLQDAYRGKATLAKGMIPRGMFGFNEKQEYFTFDRAKAAAAFREAWGGQVWERGFKLTILYNSGNVIRELGARMMKDAIESLNPKFKIDIRGMTWSSYLAAMDAFKLPVFWIGWLADFPDPHNFAFHFMHSDGTFPHVQKFKNEEVDRLVTAALKEPDRKKREQLYFQLNQKYFELVPSFATVNAIAFRVQRTWVKGWYYNPMFPGVYYYTISKG
jgi:peptide/nickel transport system substrate-binding protein